MSCGGMQRGSHVPQWIRALADEISGVGRGGAALADSTIICIFYGTAWRRLTERFSLQPLGVWYASGRLPDALLSPAALAARGTRRVTNRDTFAKSRDVSAIATTLAPATSVAPASLGDPDAGPSAKRGAVTKATAGVKTHKTVSGPSPKPVSVGGDLASRRAETAARLQALRAAGPGRDW
jgi:hypothetical protein